MRFNQRKADQLREICFKRQYTAYAEGSVLVCYGNTKVLCNVSVTEGVPRFLKTSFSAPKKGWLTAEYSMLPRATAQRTEREATRGKQSGRTVEIQRLIGRALRNCVNLTLIGEHTLVIDCDVIQADGGTRTAAISGGCIALYDACTFLVRKLKLKMSPFRQLIAAVSVGVYQDMPIIDLDYHEDSQADTDMNIIMDEAGHFIELQATGEKNAFHEQHLQSMLSLGQSGIAEIIQQQKKVLGLS